MEITPAIRATKVRAAKTSAPKSSAKPSAAVDRAQTDTSPEPRKRAVLTKKKAQPANIDLTDMIATAAYYLAEQRQFAPGCELQDWLTAEQLIVGRPIAPKK